MRLADDVKVKVTTFQEDTEQTDRLIRENKAMIDKFQKRASNQDTHMRIVEKWVTDFTFEFNHKIDRMIKDIAHRFSNYTQANVQVENLQSRVDFPMTKKTDGEA